MSTTTTMMTSIGENIVVNFTSSTDQYSCTLYIKLPSGRCLSFPSFNCSTGKEWHMISFYHYNYHLLNSTAWYCGKRCTTEERSIFCKTFTHCILSRVTKSID